MNNTMCINSKTKELGKQVFLENILMGQIWIFNIKERLRFVKDFATETIRP